MSDQEYYDFEKYIDKMLMKFNKDFLRNLGGFSQTLLEYVSKGRRMETYDYLCSLADSVDLFQLIDGGKKDFKSQISIVEIGRFILMTAKNLRESMRRVIDNDFPKFLGERANFWRYLMHLIHRYCSEAPPDFTNQFLTANTCYVELMHYCYEFDQHHITQHDKIIWIIMILHYFGRRLAPGLGYMSVLNLPLVQAEIGLEINPKTMKRRRKLRK